MSWFDWIISYCNWKVAERLKDSRESEIHQEEKCLIELHAQSILAALYNLQSWRLNRLEVKWKLPKEKRKSRLAHAQPVKVLRNDISSGKLIIVLILQGFLPSILTEPHQSNVALFLSSYLKLIPFGTFQIYLCIFLSFYLIE